MNHARVKPAALKAMLEHGKGQFKSGFRAVGLITGKKENDSVLITHAIPLSMGQETAMEITPELFVESYNKIEETGIEDTIIGWYYSNPGYSCFMLDKDVKAHRKLLNFCNDPIVLVLDPVMYTSRKPSNEYFKVFTLSDGKVVQIPSDIDESRGLRDEIFLSGISKRETVIEKVMKPFAGKSRALITDINDNNPRLNERERSTEEKESYNPNKEITLIVADAEKKDLGKSIVRIKSSTLACFKLKPRDIIELLGTRSAPAIVLKCRQKDEELDIDIVRMDSILRKNAGVSIGDTVRVKKVEPHEARIVQLASVGRIQISCTDNIRTLLMKQLLGKPVMKSNKVFLKIFNQVFAFLVYRTDPEGVVVIINETLLGIKEKEIDSISSTEESENEPEEFKFDIAISFAGEDRKIAEELVSALCTKGVRVFYDRLYQHDLWGKNLKEYFQDIYGPRTRFVVVLISEHYPVKDWTDFEFSIMRDEAKKRKSEFILPIKLDETKIIGIHEDIGYLDYKTEGIDGIADCLLKKLEQIVVS